MNQKLLIEKITEEYQNDQKKSQDDKKFNNFTNLEDITKFVTILGSEFRTFADYVSLFDGDCECKFI